MKFSESSLDHVACIFNEWCLGKVSEVHQSPYSYDTIIWGSISDEANNVALYLMMLMPCDLFELRDALLEVSEAGPRLQDGELKVELIVAKKPKAAFHVMVPELSMPTMLWFRCQEM
jgi:hypothetical protein